MLRYYFNDCLISFIAVSCLKFLFLPMYKSTDLEVHRNWMAITHQKPIKEWYTEATSQWTLDYPPLFAWFEYILSTVAKYFDPKMLQISNLNYESSPTIFFMRLSVILSDAVYYYAINRFYNLIKGNKETKDPWLSRETVLAMLLLWNPGLLIVDHIHFQYNGFLSGFLFLSLADMFEKNYVKSAMWFCVLINLKHIYLYLAPAYFLFLFKNYCFKIKGKLSADTFLLKNFLKLAGVCISVVLISFGPFIYMGQLSQVLLRLFPVKRGLTHSYWAPNVWALYNFLDRVLSYMATLLKMDFVGKHEACSTRGLVQECRTSVLPTISPGITLILAVVSVTPMIYLISKKPGNFKIFLDSVILCSFASFLFGYHVHEKAILLIILPLTLSAVLFKDEVRVFILLSVVGHFSLFPLLHQEGETPVKILLLLLHAVYAVSSLRQLHQFTTSLLSHLETAYICGLVILQLFYSFGSKLLNLEEKLPFLSLMLISTYCALGVLYCWIQFCFSSVKELFVTTKKIKRH